jgi:hypothetical protein
MEMARQMGIANIEIRSDSRVIVEQINGSYAAQETRMSECLEKVHQFYSYFDRIVVVKIPREKNGMADALSRIGSGSDPAVSVRGYKLLTKAHPTVLATEELMQVAEAVPEWATEIVRYLRTSELPPAKEDAQRIVRHSARYVLVGGTLYRRVYSFPLLKCLPSEDANYVLKEVHHGVCGNHSGAKALVNKVVRAGYYWPTMSKDAAELVRVCDACQRFCRIPRSSPKYLHSITSPWPFAKWGSTLSVPCRREKVTRSLYWWQWIISLSGRRPRRLRRLRPRMSLNSYGSR